MVRLLQLYHLRLNRLPQCKHVGREKVSNLTQRNSGCNPFYAGNEDNFISADVSHLLCFVVKPTDIPRGTRRNYLSLDLGWLQVHKVHKELARLFISFDLPFNLANYIIQIFRLLDTTCTIQVRTIKQNQKKKKNCISTQCEMSKIHEKCSISQRANLFLIPPHLFMSMVREWGRDRGAVY